MDYAEITVVSFIFHWMIFSTSSRLFIKGRQWRFVNYGSLQISDFKGRGYNSHLVNIKQMAQCTGWWRDLNRGNFEDALDEWFINKLITLDYRFNTRIISDCDDDLLFGALMHTLRSNWFLQFYMIFKLIKYSGFPRLMIDEIIFWFVEQKINEINW